MRPTVALVLLGALTACEPFSGGSTAAPSAPAALPGLDVIDAVPMGDVAGAAQSEVPPVPNPYAGSKQAVQQGKALYIKMNCAGCHGYGAGGGMGPNLKDGYWRYGGTPVAVFKSIHDGRPQGMPAWSPALPAQEIWKIVAYIQSLGGTYPADEFQASIQGDLAGENVAPESKATVPADATAASAPDVASKTSQNVAPKSDVEPPGN